jgi:predicted metal-binding protein
LIWLEPYANQLKRRKGMKKIGIIRCQQTEDVCPGTTDFKTAARGTLAFEPHGSCEIVGFVSCGGCPGKRAVSRAKMLVDRGAEVVFLASCIKKGTPIGMPCPNYEAMCGAIEKKIESIPLIDWTH